MTGGCHLRLLAAPPTINVFDNFLEHSATLLLPILRDLASLLVRLDFRDVSLNGDETQFNPLSKITVRLTFQSTSPLKMSLLAMSTRFQATASFSSSRKSWASWLWLLQADTHTHTHTHTQDVNRFTTYEVLKMSKPSLSLCLSLSAEIGSFSTAHLSEGTLPLTRALRMTVSSSVLSCSGSWTVRRCT